MLYRAAIRYVFAGLFLLLGLGAAVAEVTEDCCKSTDTVTCCCVDVERGENCVPQLCGGVKSQGPSTAFTFSRLDISAVLQSSVVTLDIPVPLKPVLSLAATAEEEPVPLILFADLTLCFLPPPR